MITYEFSFIQHIVCFLSSSICVKISTRCRKIICSRISWEIIHVLLLNGTWTRFKIIIFFSFSMYEIVHLGIFEYLTIIWAFCFCLQIIYFSEIIMIQANWLMSNKKNRINVKSIILSTNNQDLIGPFPSDNYT